MPIHIAMPNAIFNTFHMRLVLKENLGLIARFNVGENRQRPRAGSLGMMTREYIKGWLLCSVLDPEHFEKLLKMLLSIEGSSQIIFKRINNEVLETHQESKKFIVSN